MSNPIRDKICYEYDFRIFQKISLIHTTICWNVCPLTRKLLWLYFMTGNVQNFFLLRVIAQLNNNETILHLPWYLMTKVNYRKFLKASFYGCKVLYLLWYLTSKISYTVNVCPLSLKSKFYEKVFKILVMRFFNIIVTFLLPVKLKVIIDDVSVISKGATLFKIATFATGQLHTTSIRFLWLVNSNWRVLQSMVKMFCFEPQSTNLFCWWVQSGKFVIFRAQLIRKTEIEFYIQSRESACLEKEEKKNMDSFVNTYLTRTVIQKGQKIVMYTFFWLEEELNTIPSPDLTISIWFIFLTPCFPDSIFEDLAY